jgi:hypothetical protein
LTARAIIKIPIGVTIQSGLSDPGYQKILALHMALICLIFHSLTSFFNRGKPGLVKHFTFHFSYNRLYRLEKSMDSGHVEEKKIEVERQEEE